MTLSERIRMLEAANEILEADLDKLEREFSNPATKQIDEGAKPYYDNFKAQRSRNLWKIAQLKKELSENPPAGDLYTC